MKRLKNLLLAMKPNTNTYKEMYEGPMSVADPDVPAVMPFLDYDPTYYRGDIGFRITCTHKLAQDKPTVTILLPCELLGLDVYPIAAADHCLRRFVKLLDELNDELYCRGRPANETGHYFYCRPNGEILERNTAYFEAHASKGYRNGTGTTVYLTHEESDAPAKMCLCLRLQVQLPKAKLRKTIQMLCRDLPDAVERFVAEFDAAALSQTLALAAKQAAIREWLKTTDYCAFIANGSILPRAKGTDLPLTEAVPFCSTEADEIEVCGVRGMGIKKGVTVITGGGYSGKSTLLDALAAGIYDHALGDGRELCLTDASAVSISAEDGRSVQHVNITPFIRRLPGGDSRDFSTHHASGSTSQAANIMEAVDSGAALLLIDEDRSATNFMIRDRMMKQLITKEPITPFTDRVNELYKTQGVSTVLVIGGSGEYLAVADRIYLMEDYRIRDVTAHAKEIYAAHSAVSAAPPSADWQQQRVLYADGFSSFPTGGGSEQLAVSDKGFILIGDESIDVRGLHDIVTPRQLCTLSFMLRYLAISNNEHRIDITQKIEALYARIESEGLDFLYSSYFTTCERFLDLPRRQELFMLINRMRRVHFASEAV